MKILFVWYFCQNDVSLNFDEDPLCLENQTLFEKKKKT